MTTEPLSYLGRTTFRNQRTAFGIRQADRRAHMYLIGKTGTGKTTLLETLILQDIDAGRGLALFDPHGDLVERMLLRMPRERQPDVVYMNVPDAGHPVAFNPLEPVVPERASLAASTILEVLKKLWPEYWGPRLEYVLRNTLLTLVQQPEATLPDVLRLLEDESYRKQALTNVASPELRQFWLTRYERLSPSARGETIGPIQNKVGAFLSDPRLSAILSQPKSAFDLREVMDSGKVLLVNLAKGKIGEDSASLLGALLLARLEVAALSRADVEADARRDFFVYLDEFHSFATMGLASMLAELRKYRVNLVLAHQYLSQLEPELRDAVLGNVGTLICFRIGPGDATVLGKEFSPELEPGDLLRIPNYNVVLKLMIDGAPSPPFTAKTVELGSQIAPEDEGEL